MKGIGVEFVSSEEPSEELGWAIDNGNVAEARRLLGKGASVRAKNDDGFTSLHHAVWAGQAEICALLIEHGASVCEREGMGYTPLQMASAHGKLGIVRLLIAHGAPVGITPVDVKKGFMSPLQYAVEKGRVDVARHLIDVGGEELTQKTKDGRSLSDLAGAHAAVRELLLSKATENAVRGAVVQEGDGVELSAPKRLSTPSPL